MATEMMWVHVLVWLETDSLSNPWVMLLSVSHEDRAVQSTLLSAPVVSRQALPYRSRHAVAPGLPPAKGAKKGLLGGSNYPQHLPLHVSHHNIKKTF